ncbi:MFS transporter [Variovorax ginsengisoli]|uniref:MFS family permease n=1 Tax=Variovorax ginsengisoli TaxID=363844 RepID=A0ABT9S540_9BURK|nr:MFS transporter [Variovorax ginsengisoli]MDP9899469.1 MFS family permease [Variovorax ginsengisoli]
MSTMSSLPSKHASHLHGDAVVRAAFAVALFGWGVGFYGPPVFLHAVLVRTGWSLPLVSAAVTFHFLFGAGVVAFLPRIHKRWGVAATTMAGAVLLAAGVLGWAAAAEPWQLFVAAMFTGGGWVPLGAAGINAIIAPWFVDKRPLALAKAYNGASVGGMVFSPLWAVLIDRAGFPAAAMMVGLAMVVVVMSIATRELAGTPRGEGQDGDGRVRVDHPAAASPALWRDRRFLTLGAAMSLGLFAQIGLITQLFSLMAPSMGVRLAGGTMALATGCGMAGRLIMARLLGERTDRRRAAAASYAVQALGTLLLWMAGPEHLALFMLGVVLFGLGIGNATSLPPLIAQAEFAPTDVPRVVARSVALSQALYALAPAVLAGLLVGGSGGAASASSGTVTGAYFLVILGLELLAAACLLSGRRFKARAMPAVVALQQGTPYDGLIDPGTRGCQTRKATGQPE